MVEGEEEVCLKNHFNILTRNKDPGKGRVSVWFLFSRSSLHCERLARSLETWHLKVK